MRQLPKAIPELDGGLFVPRQVAQLLEAVLRDHETLLHRDEALAAEPLAVLAELRDLLRMTGHTAPPPAREQLALPDPRQELVARNLLRG